MSSVNEQPLQAQSQQATDRTRVRIQAVLCAAFVAHTALADWSFRAARTSSLVAPEWLRWTMCIQWLCVAMAVWCVLVLAQSRAGAVPASFVPVAATTVERNAKTQFRHCAKCQRAKPDRARHCRQCGECVLRMSHHCTLFNRCIGFGNYKTYFLALVYATFAVSCSLALDALHVAEAVFSNAAYASIATDVYLLVSMFLSLMALSAFGQHFALHFQLISNNLTLPELAEKRDGGECVRNYELPQREFAMPRAERRRPRNPFMHLVPQNWCAFLGQNMFAWPFPTNYSIDGDGTSFPISNIGH
jgi:hypothetical protein